MKYIVALFSIILSTNAYNEREEWLTFKQINKKIYKNSLEEKTRYTIFQTNLRTIQEHNINFANGFSTFKMGINRFADLTSEEFLEMLKLSKKTKPVYSQIFENNKVDGDLPDEIDWTKRGAVTEVKDQGACGSCWSFSTTGSLEGAYFIKTGKLVPLSEQNLVDCDKDCYGCGGGWMDTALDYVKQNGLMTENDYPYEGIDSRCRYNETKSVVKISGYNYVNTNEIDLQKAVLNGPVSVSLHVTKLFQFYASGIFNDLTCQNDYDHLNHGVLAVGYGISNGSDYWIVKNSWGVNWGLKGFVWMSRNKDNQCGIATGAVYPVL